MTVADVYASLRDIYDLGFTARTFVVAPRSLDVAAGDYFDPVTGTFGMMGHGYDASDLVRFVQVAKGTIPAGASLIVMYHPIPLDGLRFRLSLTSGGTALTFADAGSGWGLQLDPERVLIRRAENVSRDVDQDLTAHSTPIKLDVPTGRYPDKLVGVVARETARRSVAGLMFENPVLRSSKERVDNLQAQDDAQRKLWRDGQPIKPEPGDQTMIADNAALAGRDRAPTRWRTGSL